MMLRVLEVSGCSYLGQATGRDPSPGEAMGSEASEARCREGRSEGRGGEPEQGTAGGAFNAIALLAEAGEQHLRPKQREINHIKPAQDAVDDGPEYRVVRCIGDGNGERRTKAYAVFRSLDASDV